ncbi:7454_t:CDS:2, partial [Acaulospora colombiana]
MIPKFSSPSRDNASKDQKKPWERSDLSEVIYGRSSFYKKDQFTDKALEGNGLIPVTAIILNWKRIESLQVVVNYISKYPYVKEILIWNNNAKTYIRRQARSVDNFELNNTDVILNVFNSDKNLHDLSKYITCSMAKYDYCYFQDDDWLNLYMDSTYTNFIRNPNLIHSNTMPVIHLEHRRWTFHNADKNLHTGFTWLGCGSFVPREKVLRFLGQLGTIPLAKERLRLLDMYFSLWTNQYPYQLSNPLTPLNQKDDWGNSVDHWTVVYVNIVSIIVVTIRLCVRENLRRVITIEGGAQLYFILEGLAIKSGSERFIGQEEEPYYSNRDVRSPCINDKCLFITNIDPFPHPSSVQYSNNITHIHEHEAKFNALDFPSNDFWDKHAYHKAVDLNLSTCWNSFK